MEYVLVESFSRSSKGPGNITLYYQGNTCPQAAFYNADKFFL